jgi:hypothetical protein
MTDMQFSITNTKPLIMKKRKQPPSNNLFNEDQRNHSVTSNATLPIITVSSFTNLKQKFIRMASNSNKSTILSNPSTDFRTTSVKSRASRSNRVNSSTVSKSSLNFPATGSRPTTSQRPNTHQQNNRLLYVVNTPTLSHRTASAHTPNPKLKSSPSQQQQQQSNLSRPHSQYGHFLAYLRRQSLARLRRKQQQEAGNTDNIETTVTLNLNKHPSAQTFHSPSNYSLGALATDVSPMPTISISAKRAGRPVSCYYQLERSLTTYRLSAYPQTPLPRTPKPSTDDQLLSLASSSLLITPRNSVVDDAIMSPIIKPAYESHSNDDMLNYNYVSENSGVKYQGQMLSTAV